jgi:hypothetical protein
MAPVESLQIERNGKTVKNLFVYQLVNSEELRSSFLPAAADPYRDTRGVSEFEMVKF